MIYSCYLCFFTILNWVFTWDLDKILIICILCIYDFYCFFFSMIFLRLINSTLRKRWTVIIIIISPVESFSHQHYLFEWLPVSSNIWDSSNYFSRSEQFCNLYSHNLSFDFRLFQSLLQDFSDHFPCNKFIEFHKALIPLGKLWIQLFSLQLWVNSSTD